MNQTELIKKISKESGIEKKIVLKVFNTMVDVIKKSLLFGIDVKIKNFVNFTLVVRNAQEIINPRTGKMMKVKKRYKVKMELPRDFNKQIANKTVY